MTSALTALTLEEVAAAWRVTKEMVEKLVASKELGSVMIGSCRRVTIDQVLEYLAARRLHARRPLTPEMDGWFRRELKQLVMAECRSAMAELKQAA